MNAPANIPARLNMKPGGGFGYRTIEGVFLAENVSACDLSLGLTQQNYFRTNRVTMQG